MADQTPALNTPQEEVVEQSPTQGQTPQTDSAPQQEETQQEQGKEEGRNAQNRIREVVKEKNELKGTVESLTQQIEKLTGAPFNPDSYVPPSTVKPNEQGEIDPAQYAQDTARRSATAAFLVAQQQRAVDTIRKETVDIEREYPQLNPDSDQFDRDLSNAVSSAVEAQVKVFTGQYDQQGQPVFAINPNVSPKKIAALLMKPYQKSLKQASAEVETTTRKQVAETALRPTQQAPHGQKKAEDMTIRELEKKLGVVY